MKVHNLIVSDHALQRFRERTGSLASDMTIANTLRSSVRNGQEMELLPQFKIIEMLDHNFTHARYFTHGQSLIVVANNTIVTIHNKTANRWRKKPDANH